LLGVRDRYETRFKVLVAGLPLPAGLDRRHLRLVLMRAMNWSQTWYRPEGDPPAAIAARLVALVRARPDRGVARKPQRGCGPMSNPPMPRSTTFCSWTNWRSTSRTGMC
jgi:hypothetical protein